MNSTFKLTLVGICILVLLIITLNISRSRSEDEYQCSNCKRWQSLSEQMNIVPTEESAYIIGEICSGSLCSACAFDPSRIDTRNMMRHMRAWGIEADIVVYSAFLAEKFKRKDPYVMIVRGSCDAVLVNEPRHNL